MSRRYFLDAISEVIVVILKLESGQESCYTPTLSIGCKAEAAIPIATKQQAEAGDWASAV